MRSSDKYEDNFTTNAFDAINKINKKITYLTQIAKAHGAKMGPTWVLSAPDGSHVGLMNLAVRVIFHSYGPMSYYISYTLMDHYSWALHDSHQCLVWCDPIKVQNPDSSLAPNEMPWIEIAHQSISNFMAINTLKPQHTCKKFPDDDAIF